MPTGLQAALAAGILTNMPTSGAAVPLAISPSQAIGIVASIYGALKIHDLASTAADAGKDIILAGGVAVEVAVSEASKQTVTSIAYIGDLGRQFAASCVVIAVAAVGTYIFVRLWRRLHPPPPAGFAIGDYKVPRSALAVTPYSRSVVKALQRVKYSVDWYQIEINLDWSPEQINQAATLGGGRPQLFAAVTQRALTYPRPSEIILIDGDSGVRATIRREKKGGDVKTYVIETHFAALELSRCSCQQGKTSQDGQRLCAHSGTFLVQWGLGMLTRASEQESMTLPLSRVAPPWQPKPLEDRAEGGRGVLEFDGSSFFALNTPGDRYMQWNSCTAAHHSPGALAYVVTRVFSETSLGWHSLRRFQ